MTTRVRVLVHGLMAAAALAVVGGMYARLAGMWLSARPTPRAVPVAGGDPRPADGLPDEVAWRLPAAMAGCGFLLVVLGEGLLSLWRPAAPTPKPTPATPEADAEALLQQLLREAEANPAATPLPKGEPAEPQQTG
jgi:hypothetical protein